MKTEGLYQVDYKYKEGNPVLFLARRVGDDKIIDEITNFRPYLYINENEILESDENITIQDEKRTTMEGGKVKKVICKNIYDARDLMKSQNITTYEADLTLPLRFMIDNIKKLEPVKLRKQTLDIETSMKFPKVDPVAAREEITSICVYDNFMKVYNTFVWHPTFKKIETIVEKRYGKKLKTHCLRSEKEMLETFLKYQKITRPDVWIAWNMGFDFVYIINRMKYHHISYLQLSPIGKVYIRDKTPFIGSVILHDSLYWLRRIRLKEFSSFSLANVAEVELGESKKNVRNPYEQWKKDWKGLVEYNIHDVYLVTEIEEKRRIFEWVNEIRISSCVNYLDVIYFSRIIDIIIQRKYGDKYVFPTKQPYIPRSQKLKGGYVQEPITGLHKNVVIFDVNALYPNLIKTFNLSIDTVDKEGEINVKGVRFTNKKVGMVPSILDEMFVLRKKYKDELKKLKPGSVEYNRVFDQQFAQKFLINTTFGAFALPSFRFYKPEVADTITYLGRELNMFCQRKVKEKFGYETLMADTDSIGVKLGENEDPQIKGKEIVDFLNSSFNDFVKQFGVEKHTLVIELQKVYKTCILIAKKRYAGLDSETNDLDIAGVVVVRSDYSWLSKNIQKKILIMMLKENKTKQEIIDYMWEEIKKMKDGRYSWEDIAIPTKIDKEIKEYSSNLPKVRGVKWSNKYLGTAYGAGSKPLLLWVKNKDTDVILFDNNEQIEKIKNDFKLDMERMVERNILMVMRTIFEAMGWENDLQNIRSNMKNMLAGLKLTKQTTLNDIV